jgi:hypothetical protein
VCLRLIQGGKPRKVDEKDDGISRLGKGVVGLLIFVVVGSALFQIIQTALRAF